METPQKPASANVPSPLPPLPSSPDASADGAPAPVSPAAPSSEASAVPDAGAPRAGFLDRWAARLTAVDRYWLAVPLLVYAYLVFSGEFHPDSDSYYHMGVARLYVSEGWLSSFPWMQYSVLAENYPNVHFLQHVVLIPLALLFEPVFALKFAIVLLPFALVLSAYLVLRRWGVPRPGLWVALIAVSSPVFLAISVSIKGGALFAILLLWILDALRARAQRRAFVLAWLSAYAYVGAPLLVIVLGIWVVIRRLWDREWDFAPALWVFGGLLAGLVINPFWPDHWSHIGAELASTWETHEALVPGDFRGTEWMSLTGRQLFRLAGAPIAAWGFLLLWQLRRDGRIASRDAFGAVLAVAFLGAAMLSAKFLYQFYQVTLLFLPVMALAMRPWTRVAAAGAVLVAAVVGAQSVAGVRADLYVGRDESGAQTGRGRAAGPEDYRELGEWLPTVTEPGEVVIAPWDDFPGLFFFDTYNHYVIGMNPEFLLRHDERRFNAFYLLYHGRVADPENLLPEFFGNARLVVARAEPRNEGERALLTRMEGNPRFTELSVPGDAVFRLFQLDSAAP